MATEEHRTLAHFIKDVHSTLRKSSIKNGAILAWQEHCKNKDVLTTYAEYMKILATTHWEASSAKECSATTSRIQWTVDFCCDYFKHRSYLKYREKDVDIAKKINITLNTFESFSNRLQLIDVGSCYNPFKDFQYFKVFAVDLCPANNTVVQCDFLSVSLGPTTEVKDGKVLQLKECYFDIVTFCFLLEYIPDSELRIKACEKAYNILKPGALLIINTPDSKHVGANSNIMKCWRYTLACIGFSRIKYEKFQHMHCMAFRKSLHKEIAIRWAHIHKEPYMQYSIKIPQDFYDENNCESLSSLKINVTIDDFQELPFYYDE